MHEGFIKAGHAPTLFASFLHFDMRFTAWVPPGLLIDRSKAKRAGIGVMTGPAGISNVPRRSRTSWGQFRGTARVQQETSS